MRTTTIAVVGVLGALSNAAWADAPAASAPAQPDPDPALVAASKDMVGSWKCKGSEFAPDGSGSETPTSATMKFAVDLDKMWLRGELTIPKTKGMKRAMKTKSFRTYSPDSKTWREISLSNLGGYSIGESTGPDASGKTTWDVTTSMMGSTYASHQYEENGAKKGTRHIWGEVSIDGGKSFVKEFDVTCSK